jgi:hypothetical protein
MLKSWDLRKMLGYIIGQNYVYIVHPDTRARSHAILFTDALLSTLTPLILCHHFRWELISVMIVTITYVSSSGQLGCKTYIALPLGSVWP